MAARMISERRSALIEAANWERKRTPCSEVNATLKTSSVKDRLTALNKSSDAWHSRVKKDDELTKLTPGGRRKSQAVGKENATGSNEELLPPSKAGLLLNLDKGLETFYTNSSGAKTSTDMEMDLDAVERTEVLVTPRRPRPQKTGRGRPTDVRLNAIDIKSVQISEDPRDHVDTILIEEDGASPVAKSAKAGLEAVEDYSAAKGALKEVDTTSPYPEKMLIRVKGEKKMDVRLVSPVASSVHQSAVFILVTQNRLLKYEGENSNILERTKAAQICINITTKSDLCCTAKNVENCSGYSSTFSRLLDEADVGEEPALPLEPFENLAAKLNLVIRVTDDYQIQSVCKGERVRFSMLQARDTLIFDFGSEIYVWSGRAAKKTTGRYAVEYAHQLKTKPVPFSEGILNCDFSSDRADWCLYRRVMQGVQDILFSSKFSDWQTNETKGFGTPMTPRNYFVASPLTPSRTNNEEARLLADMLKALQHPEPMALLEDQEITRAMKDVITESIKFWQLRNEQLQEIEQTSILTNDQCYVFRWQYRIQLSGVRRLKTGEAHEKETGRERIAYFYWLGGRTTPKQQGLCALKLSHMDKEKHPHLRIAQGYETPLFLQLFAGKLIIKSSFPETAPIFLVRGATKVEGHAAQLDEAQPLRAHGVYIHLERRKVTLIAGSDCEETDVTNGLALCDQMLKNHEKLSIKSDAEICSSVQGDSSDFRWLTSKGRKYCPRFYRIYETEADELHCPQYHKHLAFPHPREKLSDTILIDSGEKLWIWSEKAPSTFSLRVAENFWKGRKGDATVVLKSHEPEGFIALFDAWKDWELVEEERTPPTPPRKLEELMVERTQTYSLSVLRTRLGLPEGIDTKNLEHDNDFVEAFKTDRSSFEALPAWKQIRMRKEAGLF